jgi:HNH endonuclease
VNRGGEQLLMQLPGLAVAAEVSAEQWQAWLADPDTRRRHEALVYRRGPGRCAYWLGAISSTGHGKFRAGSRARARPDAGSSRIVTAHVYAYQLHYGALPEAWAGQAVIRHQCDETSCQAWEDLVIGTQPDNVRDYQARRGRESGPLADRRGARGRAVAIRAAILTARRAGTSIEEALRQAIMAGTPPHQERLF